LAEQDGPGRWDDDYHRYLMRRGLVDHNDIEDQLAEYRKHAPEKYWDTCGSLVSNLPEKHDSTTWIADKAMETLESWTDQSNHLMMAGFIRPHHPFNPPSPWHEMYDPDKTSLLPGWTGECLEHDLKFNSGYFPNDKLTESALKLATAYYYSMISQIDYHVGRMIELLRQKGLYDNTLILFTADHGDFMGFHHMLLKSNYMYDPVVKVPLIVKWPGSRRAGTVSRRLVNNIDLAPTLCRAAGCEPGSRMHGHILQNQNAGHDLIFAEANGGRQNMARSKNRKLILAGPKNKNLFFDLDRDPHEMTNLYESPRYRDEIKSMENALNTWRRKNANPKPYQDHGAPTIRQPNVPPQDLSHREAVIRYYREKMLALQGRT
jgi:arylsulfatase A-like enzyme